MKGSKDLSFQGSAPGPRYTKRNGRKVQRPRNLIKKLSFPRRGAWQTSQHDATTSERMAGTFTSAAAKRPFHLSDPMPCPNNKSMEQDSWVLPAPTFTAPRGAALPGLLSKHGCLGLIVLIVWLKRARPQPQQVRLSGQIHRHSR